MALYPDKKFTSELLMGGCMVSVTEASNVVLNSSEFDRLKGVIESNPTTDEQLKKFSEDFQNIHAKIISNPKFNVTTLMDYLALWKKILDLKYQALLDNKEVKLHAQQLYDIARFTADNAKSIPADFLTSFISVIKSSFYSMKLLNNYQFLSRSIDYLALVVRKNNTELKINMELKSNMELALPVTRLFNAAGNLERLLKYYKDEGSYKLSNALKTTQQLEQTLYGLFETNIDENFLRSIVFKFFLKESYADEPKQNLEKLCDSQEYRKFCKNDYKQYKENYACANERSAHAIRVEYNGLLERAELDKACSAMRYAERFLARMKDLGLNQRYMESEYTLHISKPGEFFTDIWLSEKYAETPGLTGFYLKREVQGSLFYGVAYSRDISLETVVHEYVHHLQALLMDAWPRVLSDGSAELTAGGVCHPGHVSNLNSSHDDELLATLLSQKFPGYFGSFKWVAYLINRQPAFYKKLLVFLQAGQDQKYHAEMQSFLNDSANQNDFEAWGERRIKICGDYQKQSPEFPVEPYNYLTDIEAALESYKTAATKVREKRTTAVLPVTKAVTKLESADLLGEQLPYAMPKKDFSSLYSLLKRGANVNVKEFHTGNSALHWLFLYNWCDPMVANDLLNAGAHVLEKNKEGLTPYDLALKRCPPDSGIKGLLDAWLTLSAAVEVSTDVAIYEPTAQTLRLKTSAYALAAGTGNGVLASLIDISITAGQQHAYFNETMARVMHYGLTPACVDLVNFSYTLLAMGPASIIGFDGYFESALFYYVLNYAGSVISRLVLSKLLSPSKAFTLFFLFSNVSFIFSEGMTLRTIETCVNGLLHALASIGAYAITKEINGRTLRWGESPPPPVQRDIEMGEVTQPLINHIPIIVFTEAVPGFINSFSFLKAREDEDGKLLCIDQLFALMQALTAHNFLDAQKVLAALSTTMIKFKVGVYGLTTAEELSKAELALERIKVFKEYIAIFVDYMGSISGNITKAINSDKCNDLITGLEESLKFLQAHSAYKGPWGTYFVCLTEALLPNDFKRYNFKRCLKNLTDLKKDIEKFRDKKYTDYKANISAEALQLINELKIMLLLEAINELKTKMNTSIPDKRQGQGLDQHYYSASNRYNSFRMPAQDNSMDCESITQQTISPTTSYSLNIL